MTTRSLPLSSWESETNPIDDLKCLREKILSDTGIHQQGPVVFLGKKDAESLNEYCLYFAFEEKIKEAFEARIYEV